MAERSPRSRLVGFLVNLAVAATSTILFVILLEFGCRVAGFDTRGSWSAPSYDRVPEIGHLFKPGYHGTMTKGVSTSWRDVPVTINTLGLRGPDIPATKPAGTVRVLVLGDSFTFGYLLPEDEAFPSVLQRILNDDRDVPATVINAGVPGYSIRNEREYLENRGLALAPDLVVVTASPGDMADAAAGRRTGGVAGERAKREVRLHLISRESSLAVALQGGFFVLLRMLDPTLDLDIGLNATTLTPSMQFAYDRYAAEFGRLAELARLKDVRVLFTAIPGEITLFSENTNMQRRWKALADAQGIPFLDLVPPFKAARREGLYLAADGHLSAAGTEIVARELAAWIERQPRPLGST